MTGDSRPRTIRATTPPLCCAVSPRGPSGAHSPGGPRTRASRGGAPFLGSSANRRASGTDSSSCAVDRTHEPGGRGGGLGAAAALVAAILLLPGSAWSAAITEFAVPTPSSALRGIGAGPDGNLWFTGLTGARIGRITPGGAIAEFALSTIALGITAGPDGNLWFTEINKIGRITPGGVITEFVIPTASSSPSDIVAGADGNLWFTEEPTSNVGRLVTPPTVHITPASGVLVSTQQFDLVLVLQASGVTIVTGQVVVDGIDVTAALASCLVPGTRLAGGGTFRCPGLAGGLLPPGVHVVSVTLGFSDGSTATDTARWQVDANQEP